MGDAQPLAVGNIVNNATLDLDDMTPREQIKTDVLQVYSTILQEAGFSLHKKNIAYRTTQDRIDIIEFRMARAGYNTSFNTGKNSFEIEASVFFKFAPHPMMASFKGINNLPVENSVDGHFRTLSKPKLLLRDGFKSNQWRTQPWKVLKRSVISDLSENLTEYILPWFEKFSDLQAVKQYIESTSNFEQVNLEGRKRTALSWGTLRSKTLLAFLYLHLEEWGKAKIELTDLLKQPHPGYKNDPEKHPEFFYQQIRPEIKRGLAEIEKELI